MSSLPPACPRLLAAFQIAALTVINLVLGIVPRRSSKTLVDRVLAVLVNTAEECSPILVLAYLDGDDPRMQAKALTAVEALVLRSLSRDVAVYLFAGGPALPVTSIPNDLLPEQDTVGLLARLVEHDGKNPDNPHALGGAALRRWNLVQAVLSEPAIWALVRRLAGVLLAEGRLTPEATDNVISSEAGLHELLDEYATEVANMVANWHPRPEAACTGAEA